MSGSILLKNASVWQWKHDGDLSVHNGEILPKCSIALMNGVILRVISGEDDQSSLVKEEEFDNVIDVGGKLVLPGLQDAHIHVCMTGENKYMLDLQGCPSIEELKNRLRAHNYKYSHIPWVQGVSWDQDSLKRYPTRFDLDEACPDRPVLLWRACWHICVLNSVALHRIGLLQTTTAGTAAAGIDSKKLEYTAAVDIPDVPGGVVDVDIGTGTPTGILRERACELVTSAMGAKTDEQKEMFILEGLQLCASKGLTAVQTNDAETFNVYLKLRDEQKLPIRVFLTPVYSELNTIDQQQAKQHEVEEEQQQNDTLEQGHEQRQREGTRCGIIRTIRPACVPPTTANVSPVLADGDRLQHNETTAMITSSRDLLDHNHGSSSSISSPPSNKRGLKSEEHSTVITTSSSVISTTSSVTTADFSCADSRLVVERVKIFSDGSLGAETAALRKVSPSDTTDKMATYTGVLIYQKAALTAMIKDARRRGFRLEIHAIGDAAAEEVMDALAEAEVPSGERPVLTHCQVLGDDLITRMAQHGVIANIQPSFVPTDMRWVMKRLTDSQLEFSYAWKTLMKRGVVVAGGSDAPVESCSPLVGLYDAIYRQSRESSAASPAASTVAGASSSMVEMEKEGEDKEDKKNTDDNESFARSGIEEEEEEKEDKDDVFRPEECLTFAEALWIYTVGAATAAGAEHYLGRIEPGFAADFTVLPIDVYRNPKLLKTIKPSMVIVGGNIEYQYHGEDDTPSVSGSGDDDNLSSREVALGGPFIPGKGGGGGGIGMMFPSTSRSPSSIATIPGVPSNTPEGRTTSNTSDKRCTVSRKSKSVPVQEDEDDDDAHALINNHRPLSPLQFSCACKFRGIFCRNTLR